MVDVIAQELGVTSLRYQTVDDMVAAIGLPGESLCLYFWTGSYPARTEKIILRDMHGLIRDRSAQKPYRSATGEMSRYR